MVTFSNMVYIKRPAIPQSAMLRLGLGLRLVGVAGEYQQNPPTNKLSFYTGPLHSSSNCINLFYFYCSCVDRLMFHAYLPHYVSFHGYNYTLTDTTRPLTSDCLRLFNFLHRTEMSGGCLSVSA